MYRIALNVAISFVRKEVRRRKISVPLAESFTTHRLQAQMI
jgi:DNA-directed RNA polymerase specialized sigma24 family protein